MGGVPAYPHVWTHTRVQLHIYVFAGWTEVRGGNRVSPLAVSPLCSEAGLLLDPGPIPVIPACVGNALSLCLELQLRADELPPLGAGKETWSSARAASLLTTDSCLQFPGAGHHSFWEVMCAVHKTVLTGAWPSPEFLDGWRRWRPLTCS